MKKLLFILLLIFLTTSLFAQSIKKITAICSPFNRMYVRSVRCDELLDGGYDLDTFDLINFKSQILNCLSKAEKSNDVEYVDARAKLYISYSDGRTDSYCFSADSYFLRNGVVMKLKNDDILNIMDSLTTYKKRN